MSRGKLKIRGSCWTWYWSLNFKPHLKRLQSTSSLHICTTLIAMLNNSILLAHKTPIHSVFWIHASAYSTVHWWYAHRASECYRSWYYNRIPTLGLNIPSGHDFRSQSHYCYQNKALTRVGKCECFIALMLSYSRVSHTYMYIHHKIEWTAPVPMLRSH